MNRMFLKWCLLILLLSLFFACDHKDNQDEPLYDLFPLQAGNEFLFHYKYSYSRDPVVGPYKKLNGTKKWTLLNISGSNTSQTYHFEERFNGIQVNTLMLPTQKNDTIFINDSIRNFTITEDVNHQISFHDMATYWGTNVSQWSVSLQRYSKEPSGEIHNWASTSLGMDFYFYADSGMMKYFFNKGPNLNMTTESYILYKATIVR